MLSKKQIIEKLNENTSNKYREEYFYPVHNLENESVDWICTFDEGAVIIRENRGIITVFEVSFLKGICTTIV